MVSFPALLAVALTVPVALGQMPGQEMPGLPPIAAHQSEHGISATVGEETVDITVCADAVIHVLAKVNAAAKVGERPWMLDASQSCPGAPFQFTQDARSATIKTGKLEVSFSLARGNVSFSAANGG